MLYEEGSWELLSLNGAQDWLPPRGRDMIVRAGHALRLFWSTSNIIPVSLDEGPLLSFLQGVT